MSINSKKAKRHLVFESFRKAEPGSVLVCTDVMARGVDIPDVKWVLQYDPPSNAEAFVHRSVKFGLLKTFSNGMRSN